MLRTLIALGVGVTAGYGLARAIDAYHAVVELEREFGKGVWVDYFR